MKCELFEELIPLYVGGDLEPPEADDLRLHLKTCAHCRRLNEDFQASQNWLTGFAVPEFDEASFAKLRASVISQIERQDKRGRWFEWRLPTPSPRLVLASAAVALAVITALVAAVYRQQLVPAKTGDKVIADGGKRGAVTGDGQANNTIGGQVNASTDRKRHNLNPKHTVSTSTPLPLEALGNNGIEQPLEPPVTVTEPTTETAPVEPEVKEMLRIELQTADPNIRIIWLTPKATGSPTNKPSAQTR